MKRSQLMYFNNNNNNNNADDADFNINQILNVDNIVGDADFDTNQFLNLDNNVDTNVIIPNNKIVGKPVNTIIIYDDNGIINNIATSPTDITIVIYDDNDINNIIDVTYNDDIVIKKIVVNPIKKVAVSPTNIIIVINDDNSNSNKIVVNPTNIDKIVVSPTDITIVIYDDNDNINKIIISPTKITNIIYDDEYWNTKFPSLATVRCRDAKKHFGYLQQYDVLHIDDFIIGMVLYYRFCDYIRKYLEIPNIVKFPYNLKNSIFVTAMLLAHKTHEDVAYNNATHAKIAGIKTKYINRMELEFLLKLQFKVCVECVEYQRFTAHIKTYFLLGNSTNINVNGLIDSAMNSY